METLEYNGSVPLYLQLEEKLKNEIESSHFPSGSRLATEQELCDTYHVSRVTVRKALSLLEKDGYIERKIGKGTYVAEKKLKRSLSGNVTSFTGMCEAMGTKASARTLRISFEMPSEEQQSLMHLSSGEQVILVERIRYSDGMPVMLERDLFPETFDFLFSEDLNHQSVYDLIRRKQNITFTRASRTIDIVFADASQCRLLGLKSGYPLLRIISTTEDETGAHVTLSEQLCIGDKFRLSV